MNKRDNKIIDNLMVAVLALNTKTEAKKFFRDLLTETELIEFGKRWEVACLLSNNTPYTKIEQRTGLSSTTIARISKWLKNGMGGYKLIISRLHHTNSSRK
ncbi:MAG: YerC/YecD family TrpR-related protein [Candidatus Doudnabacteria bacterium]